MSWIAPNLQNSHNFFGSSGGFSSGVFRGLNVNPKGNEILSEWEKNIEYIAGFFDLRKKDLVLLKQGVSANVFYVDKPSLFEFEGDGMVTDKPNIILGLRTADCAPILLEDIQSGIVGVAHAGWRGAIKGVIENTINLMLKKGASISNIAAAVGPCIAQNSYEVDENFYNFFITENKDFSKFFITKNNKRYFDLENFCVDKLKKSGIVNVSFSGQDTYSLKENYYSFRRFTHENKIKKNGVFATQMSAIVMKEN